MVFHLQLVCLHEGGKSEWWSRHYRDDFFKEINSGWIEMYPEPRKEPLSKVELIRSMVMQFELTIEDHTIILNALHYYKKVEKRGNFQQYDELVSTSFVINLPNNL